MPALTANRQTAAPIDWQQHDLYRFFAFVFGSPTHKCFSLLAQISMPKALEELWSSLKCEGEFPSFKWFTSYEQYESTYISLFDVGVPGPPVPLFESAHDRSRPAQEIALENTYFYEVLGLKPNPGRAVPDYLVTQLEFLSALRYTSENTSAQATAVALARAEAEFLERHLRNWLPVAKTKLDRTGVPGFPVLMTMLNQFLKNRHASRRS